MKKNPFISDYLIYVEGTVTQSYYKMRWFTISGAFFICELP